jgi:serine/threonine protein kinase
MPIDPDRIQAVFLRAVEAPDTAARAQILEQECGEDAELRQQVEALLAGHDAPDGFLDQPPAPVVSTVDEPRLAEGPGSRVGPYKLLQQIGQGGMGVVFLAEQWEPVQRKVALKVIKPGMDTHRVVARFEAERQALALMDYPNIAKVLDAGATDSGRPYFVMELVKGLPITKYCDQEHLTPQERLQLFLPVCQAVQHTHQKGIIHRDLKPSNILIALYDGRPAYRFRKFAQRNKAQLLTAALGGLLLAAGSIGWAL